MAKEHSCNWYMESYGVKTRPRPKLQSGMEIWCKNSLSRSQLEKFTITRNWYLTGVPMAVASSISSRMI